MLTKSDLHPYQVTSVQHMEENPKSMVFIFMGGGKSIITLTHLVKLLDQFKVYGVLVVAPLRVAQTVWEKEAQKWEHTKHLTFSSIMGNKDERATGLVKKADVYLTNFDNLVWLQSEIEFRYLRKGNRPPFNMLVIDELSKMKNTRTRQGAQRGKALLKLLPYLPYRTGLTGTPASNGILDLFGQVLCIDGGERLGTSFSAFRSTYFYQTDFQGYRWSPFERAKEQISEKIGGITIDLKAEDYLDMPDKIINDIYVELPPKVRKMYDSIEKEMLVELESGDTVEVFNEASMINRTLQIANGAIYTNPGEPEWETIHDAKLEALEDIVEESAGQPVLVVYQFQHDAHKIQKKFKDSMWLSAKTKGDEFNKALDDWDSGSLTMILGHPLSMGHGIDRLQGKGHIVVWYGLNWSLDLYDQTNARLWRQGQEQPVVIHRILTKDTTDDAVKIALRSKELDEVSIREAISKYRENRDGNTN